MARPPFSPPPPDAAVYVISVAAELTGLHPQTLRTYERLGLVSPGRTGGGGRRYSVRDIELLREIAELTSAGLGLEGVRRVLDLQRENAALREEVVELRAALDQASAPRAGHPTSGPPGGPAPSGSVPTLPNKLPVLRPRTVDASVVIWRRGR